MTLPARRALALTLLAALLLLAWTLLLRPAIRMTTDRQEEIAALSAQLTHLHAIIARKPGLQRQAQTLQTESAAAGGFWTGSSSATVAADIQNILRRVVSGSGGHLKSMSEENGVAEKEFRRVTVRFDIQGTLQTIESVLDVIETSSPFLFVDGLTITAPDNDSGQERPPLLSLNLTVIGYIRAQGT